MGAGSARYGRGAGTLLHRAAMISSMTGFARTEGAEPGLAWAWELRSVNNRGLDLRLRLPAGFDALEAPLRELAGKLLRRGSVTANLSVKREETARLVPDAATLDAILALVAEVARRIPNAPPPRAEALLALPGVLRSTSSEYGTVEPPSAAVQAGFVIALAALVEARQSEGGRLAAILAALLDEIDGLRQQAAAEALEQPLRLRNRVTETVAGLLREGLALPEERLAQEIALLAARADVREEIDRLASHVTGARALLAEDAAIGRRLEFLAQEFHREANTLCAKSASVALTATGMRLKAAIEQLREQVANVE